MNPFGLSAADLLVFAIVLHWVADWPLQNHWMASFKSSRRPRRKVTPGRELTADEVAAQKGALTVTKLGSTFAWSAGPWWDRHPAAYAHAAVHAVALAVVFGWASLPLAVVHLIVDTRTPVVWWSKLVRQTQPRGDSFISADAVDPFGPYEMNFDDQRIRTRWELPQQGMPVGSEMVATYLRQIDEERKRLEERLLRHARPAYDFGLEVRFWTDQVFHIATLAIAALIVTSV